MKKVLLIGQSATIHALGEKLKQSGAQLYVYGKTKNLGLAPLAEEYALGGLTDLDKIQAFAKKVQPDFAWVSNPMPLEAGVVDRLQSMGVPCVAPVQKVATLESSKAFGRFLMEKYNIPGKCNYRVFISMEGVKEFLLSLKGNFVIKADGLVSWSEGVRVSGQHLPDMKSALQYAEECLQECGKIVIEEKLVGQEFSFMNFVDGIHVVPMPAIQDHKRAFNNDKGPNTGGMGVFSDSNHLLPFLKREEIDRASDIARRIVQAVFAETGLFLKGILYIGFMITAHGLKVLEFNVRLGDPEGINALSLLKTNLVDISEAIINQDLSTIKVEFENRAVVTKYIVPEGYPEKSKVGHKFYLKKELGSARIYYSDVKKDGGAYILGSERAIASVGVADTLIEAERISEQGCQAYSGSIYHRSDIASPIVIKAKITMMNKLRHESWNDDIISTPKSRLFVTSKFAA